MITRPHGSTLSMLLSALFVTQRVGHNTNIQNYTTALKRLNGAKPGQTSLEAFDLSQQLLTKRHHCFKYKAYTVNSRYL